MNVGFVSARMVETSYDLAAQHVSHEAVERQLGPLIESFA
jgi:hypothetical protein